VVTILVFFARDWQATLITAIALPLSILLPPLLFQNLLELHLNNMTLLALAAAVGNLVDDTVVIENMERHMLRWTNARQATSSAEVGLAVLMVRQRS